MDISGYDKVEIFRVLYNNANAVGYGKMHYKQQDMTTSEASKIFHSSQEKYFDYEFGRCMKINLSTNNLDTHLYNENNGENAAENAIAKLSLG